jgi:hypothetical protein
LAKGSDTQVLTLVSGAPSWATPSGGSPTFAAIELKRITTAQTLPGNTSTLITYDTTVKTTGSITFDGTGSVTIGVAGWYLLTVTVCVNGTAGASSALYFTQNGTIVGTEQINAVYYNAGVTVAIYCAVSDVLAVQFYVDGGSDAAITVSTGNAGAVFSIVLLAATG